MGKKGKFIDKSNGQRFHLVHRSQRDQAYAISDNPSQFVLIPAVENRHNNTRGGHAPVAGADISTTLQTRRDHINELGLPNDGYDYSQHLKEMGGGHFISKPGVALDMEKLVCKDDGAGAAVLPEEALPSASEMERNLEAITISHEFMDADIRAALFDDVDEEGQEFEALDDDFISQVMTEPEQPDFDFDAHIARLIAQSEQALSVNDRRTKNSKLHVGFYDNDGNPELLEDEEDDDEDDDDDDDEFPDYLVDVPDEAAGTAAAAVTQQHMRSATSHHDANAVAPLSAEKQRVLEEAFDRTLEQYGDDNIGYLSEAEEEEVEGSIDFDDSDDSDDDNDDDDDDNIDNNGDDEDGGLHGSDIGGEHNPSDTLQHKHQKKKQQAQQQKRVQYRALLDEALNEFLQEEQDNLFAEGTRVHKGARSIKPLYPTSATATATTTANCDSMAADGNDGKEDDDHPQVELTPEELKNAVDEQLQQQLESVVVLEDAIAENEARGDELASCQEYLKDEPVREEWDCETILSTYSTLDNHPTLIKDPGKFKPYKSRYVRAMEAAAAAGTGGASVSRGGAISVRSQFSAGSSRSSVHKLQPTSGMSRIGGVGTNSNSTNSSSNSSSNISSKPGQQIVLAGKLGLPEGFGPDQYEQRNSARRERKAAQQQKRSLKGKNATVLPACIPEEQATADVDTDELEAAAGDNDAQYAIINAAVNDADDVHHSVLSSRRDSDDNDNVDDYDNFDDDCCTEVTTNTALGRNKHETAEEKRLRKAAVKSERRQKRESKKELKSLYRIEGTKISGYFANEQSIDHVSVYKYT